MITAYSENGTERYLMDSATVGELLLALSDIHDKTKPILFVGASPTTMQLIEDDSKVVLTCL